MKKNKRNRWFCEMRRLGRETGWGTENVIGTLRAIADAKAKERMTLIEGEPGRSFMSAKWLSVPLINKRSGKRVGVKHRLNQEAA